MKEKIDKTQKSNIQENFILEYGEFDKKECGIYKIEIESHFYIGSASSKKGFSSR